MAYVMVEPEAVHQDFVPLWKYALIVLVDLGLVAAINLVVLTEFMDMFIELNLDLPAFTRLFLAARWPLVIALLLALPAYPLLHRQGQRIALLFTTAAAGLFVVLTILAVSLPLAS